MPRAPGAPQSGLRLLKRNARGLASRNRATALVHLLVGSRLDRNRGILAGTAGERLQLRHELCCGEIITHRGGDLPLRLPAQAHADLSGGICPFRSAIARWISTAQRNVVHGTDE